MSDGETPHESIDCSYFAGIGPGNHHSGERRDVKQDVDVNHRNVYSFDVPRVLRRLFADK